ncbi:hypothetical protein O181_073625, partial [Austropuccinia psidii MF-1]|nr:hypothetical protein [Austropuccinia psidii MF-1]
NICGKNSIVTICETFYELMSLKYEPEASLQAHIHSFQKLCARYNSITSDKELKATFLPKLLAAMFIQSLNGDKDLTRLVQTLYDIKPFTPAAVISRVSIEHSRRQPNEQALFVGSSNKPNGMIKGKETKSSHLIAESNVKTVSSDSDAFMIKEDMIFTVNNSNKIYLDLGAGKLVVNNLRYLSNCLAINHHINTYGSTVSITHQGTLTFKGINISPVYYALSGPVNLLLVSQLLYHNIKPVIKKDCFLLKQGQTILAAFNREGNLFVSKLEVNKVCQLAKIKNQPHTRALPSSNLAFHRLHIDTLQISPSTEQGIKYVLVIMDDYSRFNQIYFMSKKDQAQENIVLYLNELKNKVNVTPAFVHTDRGGEFDSNSFWQFLFKRGISLEQGPPESPQTNGIPIQLWVEAAKYGSLLLNLLPHKPINMTSPQELLRKEDMQIEPMISLSSLIPFGMKTTVLVGDSKSKLNPRGETLKALTYESYSDGMRFYNEESKKMRISRDFQLPQMQSESQVRQEIVNLPTAVSETKNNSAPVVNFDNNHDLGEEAPVQEQCIQEPIRDKHYEYVPYYSKAPKNISNKINTRNILEEGRRKIKPPEHYMLADTVPYSKATSDPLECNHWKDAMEVEFESLISHNTGTLVPYPKESKLIGGMWHLTKKSMSMVRYIVTKQDR